MYLLSQSGTTGVDLMGMDIVVNRNPILDVNGQPVVDPQGNQMFSEIYSIVAYGIGFQFPMASYETLNEAKSVFDYIHSKMKDGEAFLDVRTVESKVGIQKG